MFCANVTMAQNVQTLYATPATPTWRDNYTGASGCQFTVGVSNVVVSHLGYFCSNAVSLASVQATAGLLNNHYVALFAGSGTPPPIIAEVTIPAGTGADYYTNQFVWMPLDPPVLLQSNVTYYVAAMPTNGDGDLWGDSFPATFNAFFLGANTSTPETAYGPGGQWPPNGFSLFGAGTTYCVEGLANLPVDQARCAVQATNMDVAPGQTISVLGYASGQLPITYQWYYNGAPLGGQTGPILTIPNATAGANNGTYYLTATNSLGGEQSAIVTVLVSDEPVGTVLALTNMTVFNNYPANFSLVVTGTPPISLQWFSNNVVIPSLTTNDTASTIFPDSYSFYPNYPANNGNIYTAIASNNILSTAYTATNTSTLTVLPNLTYPQEALIGSLPTNLFTGNGGGGSQNAAGGLITASQSVLVTHMGYPAIGLIMENQAALAANHNLSIYLWNNGTPQLLGWATVTNGTPTNSEINGYFWAPLNPPLLLTNGGQYLISAQTYSAVDDWGGDYGVTNLNSYFSSSVKAYYVNNITWPTPPTLGGYGAQLYSAINIASMTNFTAVGVSNSAVASADNYQSYNSNVTNVLGTSLILNGFAEGQPPLYYPQWYFGGAPIPNQTNTSLTIPSLTTANAGNYYLVVSNYQNSTTVTSLVTTLTILTSPQIFSQSPVTYNSLLNSSSQIATNFMTVYSNASPTFSVSVEGGSNMVYHWFTNGVSAALATNSSLSVTNNSFKLVNVQSSFNVYCIVTNVYGSATSVVWSATVLPDPTNSTSGLAPYPQAVMALNPIDYWRMNDVNLDGQDNNSGDDGYLCNDYINGNNGIYTNVYQLGFPDYNPVTDPSDSSAEFAVNNSDVNSVLAPDMGTPAGVNAEFTVEAWVNPQSTMSGINTPTIAAKGGYFQEEFALDAGNSSSFRFEVRSTTGTAYNANSTVSVGNPANDNQWYHLVGVCDEANGVVSLYINGLLAGSTAIPTASGITNSSSTPLTIGSRSSTDSPINNNEQWVGAINDLAIYNYALNSNQIAAEYVVGGTNLAPFEITTPTNPATSYSSPMTIPVTVYGTGPIGYQWIDTNTSAVIAAGTTNGATLNASYTTNSTPVSFNNQTFELVVTNAYGSLTNFVTVTVSGSPVISPNLPTPVTVGQGQSYTYTIYATGYQLTYQWYENGSPVLNQTNASFSPSTAALGTSPIYVKMTNILGTATSLTSTFNVVAAPNNGYASAILALHPIGYWPMHEVEAGVSGDIETNYGTLGHLADAYYPDYYNLASSEFVHNWTTPSPVCGDANSVFFNLPSGTTSGNPIDGVDVGRASSATALIPPFTVECWLWQSNSWVGHGFGNVWSQDSLEGLNAGNSGGGGGNSGGVMLNGQNQGPAGSVAIDTTLGGGSQNYLVTSQTLPSNQWCHVVVTCDVSTNFSLFTNGVQCGTAVSGIGKFTPDTWTPFCVGNGRGWTRPISQVAIANVAIYTNLVLPAATIANHYNVGINPAPAVSYFNTVMASNPPVFLRMDSPPYTPVAASVCPVVENFGSIQPTAYAPGANCAFYTPGTWPGIAPGPSWSGEPANNMVAPMSGVSSWADVGYNSAYNFAGSNACSMMVTFRGNPSDDRYQTICGDSDKDWKFDLNVNGGGFLTFAADGTGAYPLNSSSVCNDGNWHQAVAVYQPGSVPGADGTINLYIDGQLNQTVYNNSSNGIQPGTNVNSLLLGAAPDYTNNSPGFGRQFNGQLCDVAIFNSALAPSQVLGLYEASGEPATAAPAITSVLPVPAGSVAQAINTMTLYAGVSPSYMVTASHTPTSYQWYTNGVLINGAWQGVPVGFGTNATLILPNVPVGWISNYCVVANSLGAVTSVVWEAQVIADPDQPGSYSRDVIADNPLAYWRMNESSGSAFAIDYAGGANAAYGQQTTNGLPGVPLAGVASELGVSMDSSATHNLWGTLTNNGIIMTTNTTTIVCWIKPYASVSQYNGLFVNRTTAGDCELSFGSGNQPGYAWNNGVASTYTFNCGAAVANNEWNMVVAVYTPTSFAETVYNASGQVVNTGPTGGSGNITTMNGYGVNILPLQDESFLGYNFIGCDPNGGSTTRIFNGEMNEMAIFNYALSPAQVAQLAASTITASPAPQLNSSISGANLVLSWTGPSPNPNEYNYTGWQLQAMTNSVKVGISTNWANVIPSVNVNQVIIPINLTNGTVFYRLMYTAP